MPSTPDAYVDDTAFLARHTPVIHLSSGDAGIAVAPALQGRVMTATTGAGDSMGWVNRAYFEAYATGRRSRAFSPFGGSERLWIGPEGGPFSLFFRPGDPMNLAHWQVPAGLDVEPFEVVERSGASVAFRRTLRLTNYSGTTFDVRVDRVVRLLDPTEAWRGLGLTPATAARVVAYESENRLTNVGRAAWTRQTGLLSVWMLGMFNAGDATTVVIPIRPGPEAKLGPAINDDYFGRVPPERLKVTPGAVFFKADARRRSKIGTSPARTQPVCGSYDAEAGVLTVVRFSFNPSAEAYVNSTWDPRQRDPYAGDVVNSYTDGPPEGGGAMMGRFYELETSSAAWEVAPGASAPAHVNRTTHLRGDERMLDAAARSTLGVGLGEITSALR